MTKRQKTRMTADILEWYVACEEYVNKFKKMFPNGLTPTLRNVKKCRKHFEVDWILEEEIQPLNDDLYSEYQKSIDIRNDTYDYTVKDWTEDSEELWDKLNEELDARNDEIIVRAATFMVEYYHKHKNDPEEEDAHLREYYSDRYDSDGRDHD